MRAVNKKGIYLILVFIEKNLIHEKFYFKYFLNQFFLRCLEKTPTRIVGH